MKAKAKKKTAARRVPAKRAPAKKVVSPIPAGHPAVSPYLIVDDAPRALEFYKKAFGAKELMRHAGPDGRIGHAEIRIGDASVYLADEHPEIGFLSPSTLGGSGVMIELTVEDVDAVIERAVEAGGTLARPVADQDYGWRNGKLVDPFGHTWLVSSPIAERQADDEH
jgi:PhnB protein